jgi:hypothetical protein
MAQYKDVKPVSTAQAELQFSPGLRDSIKMIRNDSNPTDWCVPPGIVPLPTHTYDMEY